MTLLDRFVIVGHSTNVNPWHVCTHSMSAYLIKTVANPIGYVCFQKGGYNNEW